MVGATIAKCAPNVDEKPQHDICCSSDTSSDGAHSLEPRLCSNASLNPLHACTLRAFVIDEIYSRRPITRARNSTIPRAWDNDKALLAAPKVIASELQNPSNGGDVFQQDGYNHSTANGIKKSGVEGETDRLREGEEFDVRRCNTVPQSGLDNVYRVPYRLERLIYLGTVLCMDAALYEVTFMPIQALQLLWRLAMLSVGQLKLQMYKYLSKRDVLVHCTFNRLLSWLHPRTVSRWLGLSSLCGYDFMWADVDGGKWIYEKSKNDDECVSTDQLFKSSTALLQPAASMPSPSGADKTISSRRGRKDFESFCCETRKFRRSSLSPHYNRTRRRFDAAEKLHRSRSVEIFAPSEHRGCFEAVHLLDGRCESLGTNVISSLPEKDLTVGDGRSDRSAVKCRVSNRARDYVGVPASSNHRRNTRTLDDCKSKQMLGGEASVSSVVLTRCASHCVLRGECTDGPIQVPNCFSPPVESHFNADAPNTNDGTRCGINCGSRNRLTPECSVSNVPFGAPDACALCRFAVLIVCILLFRCIDTSRVYHYIRAQPFMKLYVVFNMLEVFEKLWRSFGRDVVDELMRIIAMLQVEFYSSRPDVEAEMSCERRPNHAPSPQTHLTTEPSTTQANEDKGMQDVCDVWDAHVVRTSRPSDFGPVTAHVDASCKSAVSKSTCDRSELTSVDNVADARSSCGRCWGGVNVRAVVDCSSGAYSKTWRQGGMRAKFTCAFLGELVDALRTRTSAISHRIMIRCFDSLWLRVAVHFSCVVVYVLVHTFMHLIRVLSLNIAINSSESAMFLIVVTNNFGEIKSTVFKKFTPVLLYQVVAADIVERFHLCCDAFIVSLKVATAASTKTVSPSGIYSWLCGVFLLEMAVDWLKYTFLVKFNNISVTAFDQYQHVLTADILLSRMPPTTNLTGPFKYDVPCRGMYAFSHIPTRRIGFMSLPMVTLICCCLPTITWSSIPSLLSAVIIWFCLISFKIFMSLVLVSFAIMRQGDLRKIKPEFRIIGSL